MMNNKQLENKIIEKGLTAPRVTLEGIYSKIVSEKYEFVPGTNILICVLTLENGFEVTGESFVVSPENCDEEIGRDVSKSNALEKIWPLEGYLLKEQLYKKSLENIKDSAEIQKQVDI